MPERQRHAKIANERTDRRLQGSADVPRRNKCERQTIEEWAEGLLKRHHCQEGSDSATYAAR
jgi:hypothetical protein